MAAKIRSIGVFPLPLGRDDPYLDPLEAGSAISSRGY